MNLALLAFSQTLAYLTIDLTTGIENVHLVLTPSLTPQGKPCCIVRIFEECMLYDMGPFRQISMPQRVGFTSNVSLRVGFRAARAEQPPSPEPSVLQKVCRQVLAVHDSFLLLSWDPGASFNPALHTDIQQSICSKNIFLLH